MGQWCPHEESSLLTLLECGRVRYVNTNSPLVYRWLQTEIRYAPKELVIIRRLEVKASTIR